MERKAQTVDLLVSHSQIQFRARPFDESSSQWGKVNLEQGAVLHRDYVVFDPLPEDAFGANVYLSLTNSFALDETAQRCIVVSLCRFTSQILHMWKLHPQLKNSKSNWIW